MFISLLITLSCSSFPLDFLSLSLLLESRHENPNTSTPQYIAVNVVHKYYLLMLAIQPTGKHSA